MLSIQTSSLLQIGFQQVTQVPKVLKNLPIPRKFNCSQADF